MPMIDADFERWAERNVCPCGSGLYKLPLMDAQNIFCCYFCDVCEKEKKAKYRPEILTGYDQSDVDEPIEPEDPDEWGSRG